MEDYNIVYRILHKIFLNKYFKKSLFEIEKLFFKNKDKTKIIDKPHIFITGLPRSGTTSLLYFFNSSNKTTSLIYRDMPFIMGYNLMRIFKSKSNFQKKERYHKDSILFNLDSPEALDEVFFTSFNENELKKELISFVSSILLFNKNKVYLSKNNQNYKRLNLIKNIFQKSIFFVTIRDPLQHSYSLLSQHKNFIHIQKNNNFVLEYMNLLNHREFGKNHLPWFEPLNFNNNKSLNYWIEQWIFFYKTLLETNIIDKSNIVIYEKLDDQEYIKKIKKLSCLDDLSLSNFFKIKKKEINEDYDKNLINEAYKIYNEFLDWNR